MPQLPRALIVDDDPAFVRVVSSCLLECGKDIAIRVECNVDGALCALDEHRPHIMFLNWAIDQDSRRTGYLLSRMSNLMELDPSNYDYPTLINTGWQSEFQRDWNQQGITFQMENPWTVLERAQLSAWCPDVVKFWANGGRMRALRTLKLTSGVVDLTHCIHLSISDKPTLVWAHLASQLTPLKFPRNRAETFDVISKQIVIPQCDHNGLRTLPAFFVKANMRNAWVNLAHVESIGYDKEGEFIFIFREPAVAPVKLTKNVSHIVSQRLEMLRHWKFWPHLMGLHVPE